MSTSLGFQRPKLRTIRVHTWLPQCDCVSGGFGLHVWGLAVTAETTWEDPLQPIGEDWYGLYFDVQLASEFESSMPEQKDKMILGLVLHRGDEKRVSSEIFDSQIVQSKGSLWIGHSGGPSVVCPDPGHIPCGDLQTSGARAHWLKKNLIAWRAAVHAPNGATFWLSTNMSGSLQDGGVYEGVTGADVVYELTPVDDGVVDGQSRDPDAAQISQDHPFLQGCALLKVPSSTNPAVLCSSQLAISMRARDGTTLDCTGVQIAALLDELFIYDGPLGCFLNPNDQTVSLALWAPTAQHVDVLIYEEPRGGLATVCPMIRGKGEADDGVWRACGPEQWKMKYYTYRVKAFHPTTGQVQVMEVTDPYAHACAADAGRALVCNVASWSETYPYGSRQAWLEQDRVPPLDHRAQAVIYELHVRDFSSRDLHVPSELAGKYLAFEVEGSAGDLHLRQLACAGITHVQLLPTADFGSVPEMPEDRQEPQVSSGPSDSDAQQLIVSVDSDKDSFNWGYDPVLYFAPEGSYATKADGGARVLEHRRMVSALHAKGLRVVTDVVFNHTHAAGPSHVNSILDKCVPGYYHRRSETGHMESSTCMNNTASERSMMERLIVDSVVHWAIHHRVDGFRFDLMGHIPLRCIRRCRAALDSLTLGVHGVDGPKVLLYGEGWEFGEVQNGQRGEMSCQRNLAGSLVGSFNDQLRDAVLGGSPFADPREQGFGTGLALYSCNVDVDAKQQDIDTKKSVLMVSADKIRIGMAASLINYQLKQDCNGTHNLLAKHVHGGRSAYVEAPEEIVNYVSAHDNETLFDQTVWKMSADYFSPEQRMRANWLCTAIVALSHGIPFFHAGDEVLRSKSLDRDSYNSGDWFNALDLAGERSNFGVGLPPADKNRDRWHLMRPLLRDTSLRPTSDMIHATTRKFCELLRLRASTPLLGLHEAADVLEKVTFPGCGSDQMPGVVVMQVVNGPPAGHPEGQPICACFTRVVVVLCARIQQTRLRAPHTKAWNHLSLHPLQASSFDPATRAAHFDSSTEELVLPPFSASVFVQALESQE